MEPNTELDNLVYQIDDTITINNGANVYSSISSPYTFSATGGPYTISGGAGINSPWTSTTISPKLRLDGEGADIEVNGESLMALLKEIRERLNLITINEKLEEEWEELRELGTKYRELEQHIKDKQATWDRLKAMAPPIIE
jgi:hypothetical protein